MEGRRCRGGTEGCYKESESLLTGTNPKPCAPLPTRARQGVGMGGGLSRTATQACYGRLWRPLALEHLQPNGLTSTSNGLLQYRRGQLIGDCQVLGVARCAYPAERPESQGEYVPARTKHLVILGRPKLSAPTGWARATMIQGGEAGIYSRTETG